MRIFKKALGFALIYLPILLLALIFVFPLLYLAANSFMSAGEILKYYGAEENAHGGFHIIPDMISLSGYYSVFIERPDYLIKFWNSMLVSVLPVIGQTVISCMAGYAFAKFRFPGRNLLFFLYIVFMMLPFIVTLVPNAMVIRRIGLMNTTAALILPGIFAPFGAFVMRQVIAAVPNDIIDAGRLDGAGSFGVLFRLVLPQCKGGIAAAAMLMFIDSWNMVEQPLVYLQDYRKHPMSVFLSRVSYTRPDLAFVCGILVVIPVLLLFIFFKDEFIKGVEYTGLN